MVNSVIKGNYILNVSHNALIIRLHHTPINKMSDLENLLIFYGDTQPITDIFNTVCCLNAQAILRELDILSPYSYSYMSRVLGNTDILHL